MGKSSTSFLRKYTAEQYENVKQKLKERDNLINKVAEISSQIEELTKLREDTRTNARRLKSAAIAYDLGVSKSWVEKISEGKIVR